MHEKIRAIAVAVAALALVAGTAVPAAAASAQTTTHSVLNADGVLAQETDETDTTTPTEVEGCTPSGEPQIQQADLHTDDQVIEKGDPGRISGAIVLDIAAECPVVVQLTLNVPNNMYIEGESDVQSGGGGVVTSTFTVEPGEAKDIAAFVYGTEPGRHSVVADITYFPVGHEDMAREIDGLTMTFEVIEPVEPDGGERPFLPSTLQWLLVIVTIAVVGLLIVVGRRTSIRIRK